MPIPSHDTWIKQTKCGVFKPRSKELCAIDNAILDYHRSRSQYGYDWAARELRIRLEAWKKAKGTNWKINDRNKNGMLTKLDQDLPAAKTGVIGTGSDMEG